MTNRSLCMTRRSRLVGVGVAAAMVLVSAAAGVGPPTAAASTRSTQAFTRPHTVLPPSLPRTPELTESERLGDRRAVAIGKRAYVTSTEDGLFPAMGFHTAGEMGGVWSPPLKLLDGMWFGVDGGWLGDDIPARRFASGWGYHRIEYATHRGLRVERTTVVPDGPRAGLVGLTLHSNEARRVPLTLEAHSELMLSYPWGETDPSQRSVNRPDSGRVGGSALVFREQTGSRNALGKHDWAALVGSTARPTGHRLGAGFRGPQGPASDTEFGAGTGGQLTYRIPVPANRPVTVWFAVAGSDKGLAPARHAFRTALDHPRRWLASKVAHRRLVDRRTRVSLPGDRLLQRSVLWSKQNLADSVQVARHLRLRSTNAGTHFPAPEGRLDRMAWLGAGWPDYPWLFGTDGEYTAYASVAMGQFGPIKDHLRALRDVSEIINDGSGKVVHEVTPDGSVYFGANSDEGNTDETSKFPSAVALIWRWTGDDGFRDEMYDFTVRGMRYVIRRLDRDGDGWPEGLGNVERPGMGEEKLDNAVYTIRGLRDLADMADSLGDTATYRWASRTASGMEQQFEAAWWYGKDHARQYADSLDDPGNKPVFQRHWIGVTPMDAMLVRPGRAPRPLASDRHGRIALDQRERPCYTGIFGLYHTGTGRTSDPGGNPGATCDSVVSSVPSERNVFSLNTAIMAVAEGNFGRLGQDQQQCYTRGNARIQLGPDVWEMPGAMPEIAPEGDFTPNIDRPFTERSMVLQAWGAYGNLWPVVAQQLGLSPDLGRGALSVVPQLPEGQHWIAGHRIRLGGGSIAVLAGANASRLLSQVSVHRPRTKVVIGHVLPAGARVDRVTLDGTSVQWRIRQTGRGRELVTRTDSGRHRLVVRLG